MSTTDISDEALERRLRALAVDAEYADGWESAAPDIFEAAERIKGYAHMAADKRRLTREIAVMIDGHDAAKQPALCDVAAMVRDLVAERDALRHPQAADLRAVEIDRLGLAFAGRTLAAMARATNAGAAHEHFVPQIVDGKLGTGPISWLPSSLGNAVRAALSSPAQEASAAETVARNLRQMGYLVPTAAVERALAQPAAQTEGEKLDHAAREAKRGSR